MDQGFIKLYRKILDSKVFYNTKALQLFIYLLIKANHKPKKVFGIYLERGQLLTGRRSLSADTGQKESTVYSNLKWLKCQQLIHTQSNNKNTIITVCNYDTYQRSTTAVQQPYYQHVNNDSTTTQQRLNTNKNDKNDKNDKKKEYKRQKKHKFGDFKNVLLTEKEIEKLKDKFGVEYKKKINMLSEGLELKGYRYKSHFLAILKWSRNESKKNNVNNTGTDDAYLKYNNIKDLPF